MDGLALSVMNSRKNANIKHIRNKSGHRLESRIICEMLMDMSSFRFSLGAGRLFGRMAFPMQKAWAMKAYAYTRHTKTESKELAETIQTKGEMMTFGQVVVALGGWGWKPAVVGAKRLAAKCAMLGAPWYARDPFTELPLMKKLTHTDTETFTKAWTSLKQNFTPTLKENTHDSTDDNGAGTAADNGEHHDEKTNAEEKTTEKAKARAKTKSRNVKRQSGETADHDEASQTSNARCFVLNKL